MARKAMAKRGGKLTVQQIINGQRRNNAELAAQLGIAHDNLIRTCNDLETAQRELREAHNLIELQEIQLKGRADIILEQADRLQKARSTVQSLARYVTLFERPAASHTRGSNAVMDAARDGYGKPHNAEPRQWQVQVTPAANEARGSNPVMDAARDGYGKAPWRTVTDARGQP